jgi:branched-subunit amino acid transport protein
MKIYLIIGGMAAITFSIRYLMFAAAHRFEFPAWFAGVLRFVPPAVLSAIILPSVLIPRGTEVVVGIGSPHIVGALAALFVGLKTRNLLAVIVTGMAVFWMWKWVWPLTAF